MVYNYTMIIINNTVNATGKPAAFHPTWWFIGFIMIPLVVALLVFAIQKEE